MAITAATAAAITAVVSVVGGAVSAYGAIQQGKAAEDQANQQAKQAEYQGMIARENARLAASEKQKEAQRVNASQVVSGAGAGISLGSSSLLDLMQDTSNKYESDRQQLLRTGQLQYASADYSAGMYRSSGSSARTGSWFSAGSSFLGGLSGGLSYGNKAGWFD